MLALANIGIVGLGLIGSSLGRALRQAGYAGRRIGYSPDSLECAQALALGVIDSVAPDLAALARAADGIIIAVPPRALAEVCAGLAPGLGPRAILTDVGSVKLEVVAVAKAALGAHWPQFVPGHPLAGAERSGVAAGRADLFQGHRVLLTPLAETAPHALAAVQSLWQACGADVELMDPEAHDQVLALTSHLPHLLAYALVAQVSRQTAGPDPFRYTGGGFRDFTRIAASDPTLWVDIVLANRGPILAALRAFGSELAGLVAQIEAADASGLQATLTRAQAARLAYSVHPPEVHSS